MIDLEDATVEDIIYDASHYEDPDQQLVVGPTEEGGVVVSDYEWRIAVTAPTFREALIQYFCKSFTSYSGWENDMNEYYKDHWKVNWAPVLEAYVANTI